MNEIRKQEGKPLIKPTKRRIRFEGEIKRLFEEGVSPKHYFAKINFKSGTRLRPYYLETGQNPAPIVRERDSQGEHVWVFDHDYHDEDRPLTIPFFTFKKIEGE